MNSLSKLKMLAMMMVLAQLLFAQRETVSGKVVDAKMGEPISGVSAKPTISKGRTVTKVSLFSGADNLFNLHPDFVGKFPCQRLDRK